MAKLIPTFLIFLCTIQIFSQNEDPKIRVFLDCNFCDNTYIRQNLNNVQFVRDQNFADVHLFFLRQTNGSGGRLYEVDFIGKNEFEDLTDKITFSTDSNMTNDDVRNRILDYIKLGLVAYWLEVGHTDVVTITVGEREGGSDEETADEVEDPWNYWVFQLNARGSIDGEQTRKQLREVRRNLSKDIDLLANQINILNTFLIPILLIILMFIIPRQLGIRKRKNKS